MPIEDDQPSPRGPSLEQGDPNLDHEFEVSVLHGLLQRVNAEARETIERQEKGIAVLTELLRQSNQSVRDLTDMNREQEREHRKLRYDFDMMCATMRSKLAAFAALRLIADELQVRFLDPFDGTEIAAQLRKHLPK